MVGCGGAAAGLDGLLLVSCESQPPPSHLLRVLLHPASGGGGGGPGCYYAVRRRNPPADADPILRDPFTTGLREGGDEKNAPVGETMLESAELPAAARIQHEPPPAIGLQAGDGNGNSEGTELDRGFAAAFFESGEILHELRAKDTIFYENVTIPESEHDNVVPTGEGERAGLAKVSHGGHAAKAGRDGFEILPQDGASEGDEIRRRRRHGH